MQGPPSQFLLIRGLEPNVTEELLAKGISKLLKPGVASQQASSNTKGAKVASTTGDTNLGAREGSIKRVFVVRDRATDESQRYGFAEFSSPDEASAAITRFNSYDRFTISSKPVTVSYIHTGVFVPLFDAQHHDVKFSFSPLLNPSIRLTYWNPNLYVKELPVSITDDDISGAASNLDEKPSVETAAIAAAKEGFVPVTEDLSAKSKKRKPEVKDKDTNKAKKSTPAHLQFWSNRHAELHGIKQKPSEDGDSTDQNEDTADNNVPNSGLGAPPVQSYADPNKKCCYLCSRQFKSDVEVNKHERLSKLHQDNLKNEDLKKKAAAKLEKAGISIAQVASDSTGSEYRDRAKERRRAFGAGKISLPMKKQDSDASKAKESKAEEKEGEEENKAPTKSKGAALLSKMGWSSGEGLGARGDGTKEALETNIYATGVGLGAEGSKLGDAAEEAARNSRGDYKEFLQRTRDKAKERYESM